MMEDTRPLFWQQGLFLQPQHFQLAERLFHSQLAPYRDAVVPHMWGVCRMQLRTLSEETPSFSIRSGAFLFPDGTYVTVPGNAVVQPRSFEEKMVGEGPCRVYLGLKRWEDAGANVTPLDDDPALSKVNTRYVAPAGAERCPDLHAGGGEGEVRRLNFVLKIFWEREIESLGNHLLIPVARLERGRDGVALSYCFIPPCVTIAASERLMETIGAIRDEIGSRSRRLEAHKRKRGIQNAEFGSRDLSYLLLLRTLNRHLASLSHIVDAGTVHPWRVYGVLRELVGELSCFSDAVTALGRSVDGIPLLPDYDHGDPWTCFTAAHDLVVRLLDEVMVEAEYTLSLAWDGNYFSCELNPGHLESRNRFYLALKTTEDPREVVQSVVAVAKFSSRERMPLLIAQALPGVPLEHLSDPPRELPRSSSSLFFAVDHRSEQWELVRKWNNIALSWDQAPEDLEVEMMIVARP